MPYSMNGEMLGARFALCTLQQQLDDGGERVTGARVGVQLVFHRGRAAAETALDEVRWRRRDDRGHRAGRSGRAVPSKRAPAGVSTQPVHGSHLLRCAVSTTARATARDWENRFMTGK